MKKVIILLMFLILASSMFAQNINQNDVISANGINSTATALDSAGVFTGKAEQVIYMTSITIFIKSDQAGTGEVQFSSNGTNWDHKIPFTYTAADTTTNVYYFDVRGRYFRVIYTNGTTDQTYFRMQTWYHKQMIIPLKDKKVVVADDSASTKLDSIITNLLTQIARLDTMISDGATSKGYLLAIKDSLNLSISQLLAGLRGASNKTLTDVESAVLGLQTASETLQDVINGIAGTSPNTNTLYDLKQVLDDIQTAAESIKDTDGIKKITDALPAGTNIIGQVGIDQTTDGTTNKVQARNATHGDFQVNANLQVGDADVDATNPVISKPYLPYVRSVDTWGASADTSEYDFGNNYLKGYVTVYDSSATADTLVFEVYSYAKLGWTTKMIGFRDVVTDYVEIDNATVIVAGTTAKKFEINKLRPGRIRVRPKTPGATWQTKRVVFEGVN